MIRKNEKIQIVSYENSIKKSNEFSMAKLSHGLTLNQTQLLAFSIYSTQQNGETTFSIKEFAEKFGIEKYSTKYAKEDSKKLFDLGFSVEDLENDYFSYQRVFQRITYEKGKLDFKWADDVVPHILDLKNRHTTIDLTVTANFKSAYSWTLYDFLKSHYGYSYKTLSKSELMKLFGVENKKSYLKNTSDFKRMTLDVAISEINEHTDLEVTCLPRKEGRTIVAFDLQWTIARKLESAATTKQINEIVTIIELVEKNMINYLNVFGETDLEKLRVLNEIQKVLGYREKLNKTLTNREAKEILMMLKSHVQQIEWVTEKARIDKEPNPAPNKVFYNWLEERE